jgi:uncharacterized membrane protein YphA (DoxX/SURF4 family)
MSSLSQLFYREHFSKFILRSIVGTLVTMQGILAFSDTAFSQHLASSTCFLFHCPAPFRGLGSIIATLTTLGGFCFLIGFHFRSISLLLYFIYLAQALFLRSNDYSYFNPAMLYDITLCGVFLASVFNSPGKWSSDGDIQDNGNRPNTLAHKVKK